jgi:hypothetical protein
MVKKEYNTVLSINSKDSPRQKMGNNPLNTMAVPKKYPPNQLSAIPHIYCKANPYTNRLTIIPRIPPLRYPSTINIGFADTFAILLTTPAS